MKDIIISPPFGYWILTDWATSVIGTFTLAERKGRWMQAIRTIRPTREGWVNNMQLKNPGLTSATFRRLKYLKQKHEIILSVHASNDGEWEDLYDALNYGGMTDVPIELNLSCPNVQPSDISTHVLELFHKTFPTVIVKLPPIEKDWIKMYYNARDSGVNYFHCCNTYPTRKGGVSGSWLKTYSLSTIKQIRKMDSDSCIIGGGGIYAPSDVYDYIEAGADKLSLATIFFTPWKIKDVKNSIYRAMLYEKLSD